MRFSPGLQERVGAWGRSAGDGVQGDGHGGRGCCFSPSLKFNYSVDINYNYPDFKLWLLLTDLRTLFMLYTGVLST